MKRIATVAAASLALFACGDRRGGAEPQSTSLAPAAERAQPPSDARCSDTWRQLEKGLRYRSLGCDAQSGNFDLHLVEIDPAVFRFEVISGVRKPISQVVAEAKPKFAINTNFFDVDDSAMGLVATNDNVVKKPRPVSWQSLLLIDKEGTPRIVTHDQWPAFDRSTKAGVQAGPRLTIAGQRNRVAKGNPSLRSGVCIAPEGRLMFFVTPQDQLFDVHEMVDFAAALGCQDSMLFDGGPSAQMYVKSDGREIMIDGDAVPVYLVAF